MPSPGGIDVEAIPAPKTVEVVDQEGAIYLLRLDKEGQCIADTWHQTIEEAKAQASFEFNVNDCDWQEVESRP